MLHISFLSVGFWLVDWIGSLDECGPCEVLTTEEVEQLLS